MKTKCRECGSTQRGDEFTDESGYECPRCMSNVFYPTDAEKLRHYSGELAAGRAI